MAHSKVPRIAVLIPCLNEAPSIHKVITDFKAELPQADIYVFDNGSGDGTPEIARQAGAVVARETRRGKGYVVQAMFRQVEADVYVLIDGDDTYPVQAVQRLLAPILNDEADMVVGSRLQKGAHSQFQLPNRLGNWFFVLVLNLFFGVHLTDILSGYRTFNRRFVKDIALFSGGFEIETELTIKAVQRGFRIVETPVDLKERWQGSASKIKIVRDGLLILTTIMTLFRDYKPLTFFGLSGLLLFLVGLVLYGLNPLSQLNAPPQPMTLLASLLVLAGIIAIAIGIILHTIDRRFQEFEFHMKMLDHQGSFLANFEPARPAEPDPPDREVG
jgi:glycosyltransferase involved in cell wall biosynthesis